MSLVQRIELPTMAWNVLEYYWDNIPVILMQDLGWIGITHFKIKEVTFCDYKAPFKQCMTKLKVVSKN